MRRSSDIQAMSDILGCLPQCKRIDLIVEGDSLGHSPIFRPVKYLVKFVLSYEEYIEEMIPISMNVR